MRLYYFLFFTPWPYSLDILPYQYIQNCTLWLLGVPYYWCYIMYLTISPTDCFQLLAITNNVAMNILFTYLCPCLYCILVFPQSRSITCFKGKETKAQRGEVTCSESHRLTLPDSQSRALSRTPGSPHCSDICSPVTKLHPSLEIQML